MFNEKKWNQEKNINMINLAYTFIKNPSCENLINLQAKINFSVLSDIDEQLEIKNFSICVSGDKNSGKSLLISRLLVF